MTKHLDYVRKESDILLKNKYIKGAKEHGGDLKDMSVMRLIDEALDENTDQRIYLIEAKRKLKK